MGGGVDPGNSGIDLGRRLWAATPLAAVSTGCRTKECGLRDGFLNQQRFILFQWEARVQDQGAGRG